MQLSVSGGFGLNLFKIGDESYSVLTPLKRVSVPDFSVDPSKSPSRGRKLPALIKVCGQMTASDRDEKL